MRNRIFKLFLVLMLMVSVLAVNTNPIHADSTSGLRISSGDQYRDFSYNETNRILEINSQTTDNIEGLDISVGDIDNERYAVLQLTKDTHLYCGSYNNVIESGIPLKLSSYNTEDSDNTYTLYVHCEVAREVGLPKSYTGIDCHGSLLIENVNIVFFSELESKEHLINKEDQYQAIHVEESKHEGYSTPNVTISDSDINIYGTDGIGNYYGNVYVTNGSEINMTIKTPEQQYMDYWDFDSSFINLENGGLEITYESSVYVEALIPDQNLYSNPRETTPYLFEPIVCAPRFVSVEVGSSLEIYEPNYHYLTAIATTYLDVSGSLIIDGGIYGVSKDSGESGDTLQAASKVSGFYFNNANFEITSLLVGLNASRAPRGGSFPISITKTGSVKHTDFIKVVGDADDAEDLELSVARIAAISIYDPTLFSSDISSNYRFVAPADSSETSPFDYSEPIDTSNINQYKSIAVLIDGRQPEKIGWLNIYSYGKRVTYYPDNLSDGETDYFNNIFSVTFNEDTGFTVNVKKDFEFKLKEDEPIRVFISCPSYGLHINGNNHTLSFTTTDSSTRVFAPIACIMFSSASDSSIKDLNIKLTATDSVEAPNRTYLFVDEGTSPRTFTRGEKIELSNLSLSKVNIDAKSSSSLFMINNLITTMENSNILYNYHTPLYVFEESQPISSIIRSSCDFSLKESKLEVHGTVPYDKTKDAQVAVSEVIGQFDINKSEVKVDGIDVGIGGNELNIIDSNIDISSNRGGLIGFQSVSIKLSNGYHCNVLSKASECNPEDIIYPALYSPTPVVKELPKDCVIKAVFADGTEEEYREENKDKYVSISIVTKGSEEEEKHHEAGGGSSYIIPKTGIK